MALFNFSFDLLHMIHVASSSHSVLSVYPNSNIQKFCCMCYKGRHFTKGGGSLFGFSFQVQHPPCSMIRIENVYIIVMFYF